MLNKNNIFRFIILIIIKLSLTSCIPDQCIDSDDFGYPKIHVPAWVEPNEIKGSETSQYINWFDSNLKLSGDPLFVVVDYWDRDSNLNNQDELSAWCPFYGKSNAPPSISNICLFFEECQVGQMCQKGANSLDLLNPPCIFKRGVGLYIAVGSKDFNPNKNMLTNLNPHLSDKKSIVAHLGYNLTADGPKELGSNYRFWSIKTNIYNASAEYVPTGGYYNEFISSNSHFINGKMYFKILDTYYKDNSGQYTVSIKSGAEKKSDDPFSFLVNNVKEFIFGDDGLVKEFFNSIVKESSFIFTIKIIIHLYIILTIFNFLAGNLRLTHTEITIRLIKIIIILQLATNEHAWVFFNDNLFFLFIDGMQFVMSIVERSQSTGSGPSNLIPFMLAPHTLIKLIALGGISPGAVIYGILFCITYLLVISIILYATIHAVALQVTALIMLGVLVTQAPIFIAFTMFESTKDFFQNWLRKMISYSIQPILVIAGIAIITVIIKHNIYATLGFRVCKQYFLGARSTATTSSSADGTSSGNSIGAYVWKPFYYDNEEAVNIVAPEAFNKCGDRMCFMGNLVYFSDTELEKSSNPDSSLYVKITKNIYRYKGKPEFCRAYQCFAKRYPSFPFIDPGNPFDMKIYEDLVLGRGLPVSGLIFLILSAFLLVIYKDTVSATTDYLTSSSGSGGNQAPGLDRISSMSASGMIKTAKMLGTPVANFAIRYPITFAIEATGIGRLKRWSQDKLASKFSFVKYSKAPEGIAAKSGATVSKLITSITTGIPKTIFSMWVANRKDKKLSREASEVFVRNNPKSMAKKMLDGGIKMLFAKRTIMVPFHAAGELTGMKRLYRHLRNNLAIRYPKSFNFVDGPTNNVEKSALMINKLLTGTIRGIYKSIKTKNLSEITRSLAKSIRLNNNIIKNRFTLHYQNEYISAKIQFMYLNRKIKAINNGTYWTNQISSKNSQIQALIYRLEDTGLGDEEREVIETNLRELTNAVRSLREEQALSVGELRRRMISDLKKAKSSEFSKMLNNLRILKERGYRQRDLNNINQLYGRRLLGDDSDLEIVREASEKTERMSLLQDEYIREIRKSVSDESGSRDRIIEFKTKLRDLGISEDEINKMEAYHIRDVRRKIERGDVSYKAEVIGNTTNRIFTWIEDTAYGAYQQSKTSAEETREYISLRAQYFWQERLKKRAKNILSTGDTFASGYLSTVRDSYLVSYEAAKFAFKTGKKLHHIIRGATEAEDPETSTQDTSTPIPVITEDRRVLGNWALRRAQQRRASRG